MGRTGDRIAVWRARLLVALAVLLSPALAAAAEKCTDAQEAAADQALKLTNSQAAQSVGSVFPWGAPRANSAVAKHDLLVQREYVIGYDPEIRGPVWAADVVGLKPSTLGRIDCFRRDPRQSLAVAATLGDFDDPLFDQGHMVPNGDMTFDETAILNTFVMSNMSPQFCQFNRGVWQILETFVRSWSRKGGALYVVSGAVFDRNGDGVRDADTVAVRMKSRSGLTRVGVPSAYYKILARPRAGGGLDTMTILLQHDQVDVNGDQAVAYLADNVSTIAAVEKLTSMTFFPGHKGPRTEAAQMWSVAGFKFGSLVYAPCRKTAGARLQPGAPAVYVPPPPAQGPGSA